MRIARLPILMTMAWIFAACAKPGGMANAPLSIEWEADCLPGYGYKAPLELPSGDILSAIEDHKGAVWCYRSQDGGRTWSVLSEMVRDSAANTDIGDGHLMRLKSGELLFSFRHNHYKGLAPEASRYRLRVLRSTDQGASWHVHSEVAGNTGRKDSLSGLWSTFLLERSDGALQCYYDDEYTPAISGFPRHQWISMKTWDAQAGKWVNRVTVSRAHNPAHLSRDGMCSVVELDSGRLLCALEGVQTAPPHASVIRYVTSDDGGQTWSWQREERRIIYQPEDTRFNVTAPWMIRLAQGELLCLFTTDEDRVVPGRASTGVLDMDLKYALSFNNGMSWEIDKETLVPTSEEQGQPWRYTLASPANGWEQARFNDDSWQTGPGGSGAQGAPGSAARTPWQTGEIWLRRHFTLDQAPGRKVRLRLHHDEAAQIYINGVSALSVDGSTAGYKNYSIADAAVAALRPGRNTIAIHCRQTTGGQTIDAGLVALGNIADDRHPIYFAGVGELKHPGREHTLLTQYRRSGNKILFGRILRTGSGVLRKDAHQK